MNQGNFCAICQNDNPYLDPAWGSKNCIHLFCKDCIRYWIKHNPFCPLCNQRYEVKKHQAVLEEVPDESQNGERFTRVIFDPLTPPIERIYVYEANRWVVPLDENAERVLAEDIRMNPLIAEKLEAWINQELEALLGNVKNGHNPRICSSSLFSMIKIFDIISRTFKLCITLYLSNAHAEQFIHELSEFGKAVKKNGFTIEEYCAAIRYSVTTGAPQFRSTQIQEQSVRAHQIYNGVENTSSTLISEIPPATAEDTVLQFVFGTTGRLSDLSLFNAAMFNYFNRGASQGSPGTVAWLDSLQNRNTNRPLVPENEDGARHVMPENIEGTSSVAPDNVEDSNPVEPETLEGTSSVASESLESTNSVAPENVVEDIPLNEENNTVMSHPRSAS